jgi:AraC-like DNA-binding protein
LGYAKRVCGDCRFHFPRRAAFHGSIERRTLAGAAFTCFSSTAVSFAKFPAVIGRSAERDAIIITQLRGTRRYCQQGKMAVLGPGDTTLIDAGEPWTSDCADDCARLYLRVPRWRLEDFGPVLPHIIGKQGLGAALFRLARSAFGEAEAMSFSDGAVALEAYLALLAGCLGRPETCSTRLDRCGQLRPRIEHHIESNLADPGLNPARIAAGAGISVRHLHRLFAAEGYTVLAWIRERRLERCRGDLANPGLTARSITDIAFRWGFSDSAHFSHCFRREFGVSPRQFRSRALAGCHPNQKSSLAADDVGLSELRECAHNSRAATFF